MNNSDHQFLHKIAQEDRSEVELGHLALQKSNSPQVKDYARNKILAADPSMEQHAKNIAQKDNATVSTSPNAIDRQEYQKLSKLSKLSGQQFDKEYMNYEARKQKSDLELVQHEINNTNNSQVKNYAQKEETPVRQASESAQQIATSLRANSSASTTR